MANLADCNRIIPRVRSLRRERDKLQKQLDKLRHDHYRRLRANSVDEQFYPAEKALEASLNAVAEQLASAMADLRRVERGNR